MHHPPPDSTASIGGEAVADNGFRELPYPLKQKDIY